MEHSLKVVDDIALVSIAGELSLKDEEVFRTLSLETSNQAVSKCIVDLTRLDFLDSAGLGLLLVLNEFCDDNNIKVFLRPGSGDVREILDISEFSTLIPYDE